MRTTIDGNEAAASVAFRLNEVCCIYPITPSSPMAELADEWSSQGKRNVWGGVPSVVEMQSEGGAAGALHGALQGGALATTFTASQGLLLMIPIMYKIAGELTPAVIHVAARSLAAQSLSIFGDHSDVMAVRATGFALLSAGSVQEAHDLALVAQAATLRTRVPFVHFFDGFRTSHELNTVELLSDDDLRALVPEELVHAHRDRALSPERPFIRGTAQNPDVYFQARETVNPFYARVAATVEEAMARLAERTGRPLHIVEYSGDPHAKRVLVLMGPYEPGDVWEKLSRPVREQIVAKGIELYAIDAGRIAREAGLPGRTNTILQACFFATSGVLPREEAIARIKASIEKGYGRRGDEIVRRNNAAVDSALDGLHKIDVPRVPGGGHEIPLLAKYLLAGSDVVMTASSLLRHGPEHATALLDGRSSWMAEKGFASVDELRGLLAVPRDVDALAHERSAYVDTMGRANAGVYAPWSD